MFSDKVFILLRLSSENFCHLKAFICDKNSFIFLFLNLFFILLVFRNEEATHWVWWRTLFSHMSSLMTIMTRVAMTFMERSHWVSKWRWRYFTFHSWRWWRHKERRRWHVMSSFPMMPPMSIKALFGLFVLFLDKFHFYHIMFMRNWYLAIFAEIKTRTLSTFISNSTNRVSSATITLNFMF